MSLNKHVNFLGRRDDVLSILAASDVFILTSSWEGMPNVLIEAMFSKLPVVCTSVDGAKEIISNQVDGILVKSEDVDDMVNNISLLLDEKKMSLEIAEKGYRLAKSLFDSKVMVKAYIKLIEQN